MTMHAALMPADQLMVNMQVLDDQANWANILHCDWVATESKALAVVYVLQFSNGATDQYVTDPETMFPVRWNEESE